MFPRYGGPVPILLTRTDKMFHYPQSGNASDSCPDWERKKDSCNPGKLKENVIIWQSPARALCSRVWAARPCIGSAPRWSRWTRPERPRTVPHLSSCNLTVWLEQSGDCLEMDGDQNIHISIYTFSQPGSDRLDLGWMDQIESWREGSQLFVDCGSWLLTSDNTFYKSRFRKWFVFSASRVSQVIWVTTFPISQIFTDIIREIVRNIIKKTFTLIWSSSSSSSFICTWQSLIFYFNVRKIPAQ